MPRLSSPETQQRVLSWLKAGWDFTRNPFANYAAEQEETVYLQDYFIDTGRLDWIWGNPNEPQTTLFFARRGCGKTAHRRMIELKCCPARFDSPVLAVLYSDFSYWSELLHPPHPQDHKKPIMAQVLQTILLAVAKGRSLTDWCPEHTAYLKQLCLEFQPDLLQPASLLKLIRQASPPEYHQRVSLSSVRQGLTDGNLTGLLVDFTSAAHFFGQLGDAYPTNYDLKNESLRIALTLTLELTKALGFAAIYILVDGVDEVYLANEWGWEEGMESLLIDLPLLTLPGVAFKFFLPAEVQDGLLARERVRADRLPYADLTWSETDLRHLLQQRLSSFNGRGISSLADLCVPELRMDIDERLVEAAHGVPRHLLRLGNQLLETHTLNLFGLEKISRKTWEQVVNELNGELDLTGQLNLGRPKIIVNLPRQKISLGDQMLSLTANESRFILCLAHHNSYATTDQIIDYVYDGAVEGVTDSAITSLVKRLRQKLGDEANAPFYLRTEHGRGYTLLNWQRQDH